MDEAISALETGPLDQEERQRVERIGAHVYNQFQPSFPAAGDTKNNAHTIPDSNSAVR